MKFRTQLFLIFGGFLILLITACLAKSPASITFNEQEFDFGVIKQSGGKVSHEFTLTNSRGTDLKILSTPTSCSCTEATADKTVLKSGESGKLNVIFNPNLHEEPEGRFYKTVAILTEPAISPPPEVKIWVQIDLDLGPSAFELKTHSDDSLDHGEELDHGL